MSSESPRTEAAAERRALGRLSRRLLAAAFTNHLATRAALALSLGGVWLLFVRGFRPDLSDWTRPLLLGLGLIAVGHAALSSWRGRLDPDRLRILADLRSDAGGLGLALHEVPDGRWEPALEARLRHLDLPETRLRERTRLFLPALLFFAVASVVPVTPPAPPPASAAGLRLVDRLQERMMRMAAEELLGPEERERLGAELGALAERIREEGLDPESWEAVDALAGRLDERLATAGRAAARAAEALRAFEGAADRGAAAGDLGRAVRELAGLEGLQGLETTIGAEDLQRLLSLAEGLDADALDAEALARAMAGLEGFLGGRADLLEALEAAGIGELRDALAGRPGRGGVNRGRADAWLGFAGETPEHARDFALERVRPKAAAPDAGELLAVTAADPNERPDEAAVRGAERRFEDTEQDATVRRRILPRHRGAVRRFFEGANEGDR